MDDLFRSRDSLLGSMKRRRRRRRAVSFVSGWTIKTHADRISAHSHHLLQTQAQRANPIKSVFIANKLQHPRRVLSLSFEEIGVPLPLRLATTFSQPEYFLKEMLLRYRVVIHSVGWEESSTATAAAAYTVHLQRDGNHSRENCDVVSYFKGR